MPAFIDTHMWVLNLFSVVLITAVVQVLASFVFGRLTKKAERTKIIYDEALVKAIRLPVVCLIWLTGLSAAGAMVLAHNQSLTVFEFLPQIKKMGYILAVSWGLIRFIRQTAALHIRYCVEHSKEVDKTMVHAISQLLTVSVVITTVLAIMQLFGLPISGLLAFGGLGGAAVAFASKDLLANFFGGMVLYMDRPFSVGDWIRSPDKNIEGVVEYIGWRVTRIRTFDKRPLYVPNGVFLNIGVENPSRMTNRRIKTNIGIRYQDASKMDAITNQVKQMLLTHPEIDTNQLLIVNFASFGPSSLDFLVYTFTKTTNWAKFQEIQHAVFLRILNIVETNGAECAFPTQTLHIQQEDIRQAVGA